MRDEVLADRDGHAWATLRWDGDELHELAVDGAIVHGAIVEDALLGPAHEITASGAAVTRMSRVAWARPTEIPVIAAPGRLPAGSGAAILNVIAMRAERAGVAALHYAGPYPTPALWKALARSFRTDATEAELTRDLVTRMATLARDPIPVAFRPAPHERIAIAGGHVERRDGIERVVLDGIAYEPDGSPARLVRDGDAARAELWFGDTLWSHVATVDGDGRLVEGPHAIRTCTSDVVGKVFPPPLVSAIAELVAEIVPVPLGDAARGWLEARTIRWADLGGRAARRHGDEVEVHAAIWQRVGAHGAARLALALAEAIAPVVTSGVIASLAAT
ncbi:MAG TPA: hypothetical protein VFQ53_22355 [Kofleriaceae bacterium]|nr:hypothetical protein [Kofleriaceae bacterium]